MADFVALLPVVADYLVGLADVVQLQQTEFAPH